MTLESETLVQWWRESKNVVFFGGAGVSTESGVADYRSAGGIYEQEANAEEILTPDYMYHYPEEFYRFCRRYFLVDGIRPNAAHEALARLEEHGKLDCIITQNIDGLHQHAGSKRVIELHGNTQNFTCVRCGNKYDASYVKASEAVPYCEKKDDSGRQSCKGMLRPDIVLYEESLDNVKLETSARAVAAADLLIVGGSSLQVWPAASLVDYQRHGRLVLINQGATGRDRQADLVIRRPIGEVFSEVVDAILSNDD